jgi:hypothetical protein
VVTACAEVEHFNNQARFHGESLATQSEAVHSHLENVIEVVGLQTDLKPAYRYPLGDSD